MPFFKKSGDKPKPDEDDADDIFASAMKELDSISRSATEQKLDDLEWVRQFRRKQRESQMEIKRARKEAPMGTVKTSVRSETPMTLEESLSFGEDITPASPAPPPETPAETTAKGSPAAPKKAASAKKGSPAKAKASPRAKASASPAAKKKPVVTVDTAEDDNGLIPTSMDAPITAYERHMLAERKRLAMAYEQLAKISENLKVAQRKLMAEKTDLKTKLEATTTAKISAETELKATTLRLGDQVKALKDKAIEQETAMSELKDNYASAQKEIKELKGTADRAKFDESRASTQKHEAGQEVARTGRANEDLKGEVRSLKLDLKAAVEKQTAEELAKKKVQFELKELKTTTDLQIKSLKEKLAEQSKEFSSVQKKYGTLQKDFGNLKVSNAELDTKLKTAKSENARLDRELNNMVRMQSKPATNTAKSSAKKPASSVKRPTSAAKKVSSSPKASPKTGKRPAKKAAAKK